MNEKAQKAAQDPRTDAQTLLHRLQAAGLTQAIYAKIAIRILAVSGLAYATETVEGWIHNPMRER